MEILMAENQQLKNLLVASAKSLPDPSFKTDNMSDILKLLLKCAQKNAGRKQQGLRYDNTFSEFCTLCFTLGGPQLYELFQKNLHFPSITTVTRRLTSHSPIQEGVFRIQELKNRMISTGIHSTKFHISEDGTSINGRIQFDLKTNRLVGFVLPLQNGLPVPNSFLATSASEMKAHFQSGTVSRNAYTIMAQPLPSGSPFCVALFGTDNKFDFSDVLLRWRWMEKAFTEAGLVIDGFSSDGDPKLLKAMYYRTFTHAGQDRKWPWYHGSLSTEKPVMIQDSIHLLVKLRAKLLKPSEIIPFGKSDFASKGVLTALLQEESRDQHELTPSVLLAKDKMNFRSAQKLCDSKVCKLLRDKIPNSEGTAVYLDMMRETTSVFLEPELLPLQRIFLIWKWIFFLRLWRKWLLRTDGYTLSHNFISSNAYTCVELNGHEVIKLVRKRREEKEPGLLSPTSRSSQPCEAFYRRARAMDSSGSNMATFSMLDFENRIRRLDFIGESTESLQDSVIFPRLQKLYKHSSSQLLDIDMPEDVEIEMTVKEAFKAALHVCVKFGMASRQTSIPKCELPLISDNLMPGDLDAAVLDTEEGDSLDADVPEASELSHDQLLQESGNDSLNDVTEDLLLVSSGAMGLKSFENVSLSSSSPFVQVLDGNGKSCIIKKTSFCWLLSSGDTKLSSDRLQRVQADQVRHSSACALSSGSRQVPTREDEISIGDWCAFDSEDGSVAVGRVHAFSFMSGSTWRGQQYSGSSAAVKSSQPASKSVGCLCLWFTIQKNGKLQKTNMDVHGYYPIEKYICSIPRPKIEKNGLVLQCSVNDISKLRKHN